MRHVFIDNQKAKLILSKLSTMYNASALNKNINLANSANFVPNAENSRLYRNALGQFATGVTIVTVDSPDGPMGMTVNSFTSVSLEPALVLWSLSKSSKRYSAFQGAHNYAIHVVPETQKQLANDFAKTPAAFDQCEWIKNSQNVPLIKNMLACFECKQTAIHDAGDHIIIVGQVVNVTLGTGMPLIFAQGEFGGISKT